MVFIHSLQSEWLKKKGSAAAWLTLIGGVFIPLIVLVARIVNFDTLYAETTSDHLWDMLFHRSWQFMAYFLLPMGVILATSLITQLEFRNNSWKQLHTTPQSYSTIFFSKLTVIVVMMLQFFVLFNIGIYLAGMVPSLIFRGIPFPKQAYPLAAFLRINAWFFVHSLPIIAFQYLVGLQFKNFLVPLGIGIGLFIASIIAVNWQYGYILPYSYCPLYMMGKQNPINASVNIHAWAFAYFMVFTILSYTLYLTKKEKG